MRKQTITNYVRMFSTFIVLLTIILFEGCKKPKELLVSTLEVTNITTTTATLNGSYEKGDDPVTSYGFAYKEESETQWKKVYIENGAFKFSLTELKPETRYHVIAFAKTAKESIDGNLKTFTTSVYTPNTFTVTFDANGGTGNMPPQIFTEGVSQNLSANIFSRVNHTFDGWNTAEDGSAIAYDNQQNLTINNNLTLFAQWVTGIPCPGISTVTDIEGNIYSTVLIGTQCWLKENLKTKKYDTESELHGFDLYVGTWGNNAPSYVDASQRVTVHTLNLTVAHRSKLGYLYNYAAVVGKEDVMYLPLVFPHPRRQGICPNGWHVPTEEEFRTLQNYLGNKEIAGTKMRTRDAWHDGDGYIEGTNTSGFSALPAGAFDIAPYGIGQYSNFWTSTALNLFPMIESWMRYVSYNSDKLAISATNRYRYFSVRCLKN